MLRYKTETRPGLVALYDIRPGNRAGQFLQPRSPHGAVQQRVISDKVKSHLLPTFIIFLVQILNLTIHILQLTETFKYPLSRSRTVNSTGRDYHYIVESGVHMALCILHAKGF